MEVKEQAVINMFKKIKESVEKKITTSYFPIRKRTIGKFKKGSLREIETQFKGIIFVVGKLKAVDKVGVQSIRFDLNLWTSDEAKRWYKNNLDKIKKLVEVDIA